MKFRPTLVAISMLTVASQTPSAAAETLWEALAMAYANNPTLLAQRAALRAADESVPQALSGWRPSLIFRSEFGKRGIESTSSFFASKENRTPESYTLTLTQPLFRGGRTVAGTRQAENQVLSGRELLRSTEQDVLLQGVTAYVDVLRDQAVVELTRNNERVLARQLEATKDRFEVGELTRTDVAQSEARHSRASSERIRAEGDLIASRATYKRVIGDAPGGLEPTPPLSDIPATEEEAMVIAEAENPQVVAARFAEDAATHAVRVTAGTLLPEVDLAGELNRSEDSASRGSLSESASILARLSVPLYQSGAQWSRLREARQTLSQRRIEVRESLRGVTESVTRGWEALQTAQARIVSDSEQVRANEIALDGVREEATVGARTILDVLDAEQELLDSRVALVRTERDEYVAAFQLKQAIGRLQASLLPLPVELYDPARHYDAVRGKWFGLDDLGE
jgi:TolC family type I secretion outer membrane protein